MDWMLIIEIPGLIVFSYLLGSIPWGLVLTRCFTSKDLLGQGSGNIGATNVARISGAPLGISTLILDVLKGAIPVTLAGILVGESSTGGRIFISMVALSAFLGHLYPLYLKFEKGGKGVATAAGCFLVISFPATLVALLTFILFLCISSRASVGSLAAAAILSPAIYKAAGSPVYTACAVIASVLIFIRHKDNIVRLISGEEPPIW